MQRRIGCGDAQKKSGSSHLYCGDAKPGCSDSLPAGIIESSNIFVLRRILVKLHIRTRLIKSFRTTYGSWSCAEEKLHCTPVHTLHQLERDEGLFPPLPISLADRNGLKNLPRQIFSACVKFGGNPCRDVEPVHNTVTMYALCAMPFLNFRMLLFFSITSYPAEIPHLFVGGSRPLPSCWIYGKP